MTDTLQYLPETFIPNSRTEKRVENEKAIKALELAKSLKRPVRYAKPGECSEYNKLKNKKQTTENDVLNANDAAYFLGIGRPKLNRFRREGKIEAIIHKQWFRFERGTLEEFKKKHGPLYSL